MFRYCLLASPILLLTACGSGDETQKSAPKSEGEIASLGADTSVSPERVEAAGVPVPPDSIVLAAKNLDVKNTGIASIMIESAQTPEAIEAWYRKALSAKGYSIGPVIVEDDDNGFNVKAPKAEMSFQFQGQKGVSKTETLIMLDRQAEPNTGGFSAKKKGWDNG